MTRTLYATCDHGFEAVLADELGMLGAHAVVPGHRGVHFAADREGLWRITLGTRIANRILMPIAEFPATSREAFHAGVQRIHWTRWFGVDRTFVVDASSHRSSQEHTGFIAQVTKDAICDRFRADTGRRPDVNRERPDVVVNIHLDEDHCIVSLDAAGSRLHRRGWRTATGDAPLKETLAAGMLRMVGWQPSQPLIDPMCGSGTFLVEAALIAQNVAPGLLRLGGEGFAFQRWVDHDPAAFARVEAELRAQIRPDVAPTLVGWDADLDVLAAARHNARRAGVNVRYEVGSLNAVQPPEGPAGLMLTNPPYGVRLAADQALYVTLGDVLKQRFAGWTAWLFVANEAPIKSIGLKPSRKIPLRNGPIECRLCRYELYSGSRDA